MCTFAVAKANVLVSLCSSPHLWSPAVQLAVHRRRSKTQAADFPLNVAVLILKNRITSSDIQDTVRIKLLYVERSIWSGCLHDVSGEGFLAQKEYLEASPRQDVSHVVQEHLCFLLEEVGGFPTCVSILCSLLHAYMHSPLLPLPQGCCCKTITFLSTEILLICIKDYIWIYIFVFFSLQSYVPLGVMGRALETIPAANG